MYHKLAEGQAKTICHEIFREVQMQVCKLTHLSLSLCPILGRVELN